MKKALDFPEKKLKSGDFKNMSYHDVGEGYPVMLVHGFPADARLWDYQAEKLHTQFRLLIPDLPGSGNSPLPASLSIESMADSLQAVLEMEDIDQCVLIGHSMGGYAALAFADKYPEKLKGLGLFHSSAFADTPEKKEGRLRSIDLMRQYGADTFLRQMIPGLFSEIFKKDNKPQVQALINSRLDAKVNVLETYYRAMMQRPERTGVLKHAKVPVLFVIGKEDTAVPMEDILQQVSLPAVCQVHLFEEVAHLGMLEAPEASTLVIKQFINFCRGFPFSSSNTQA